MRPGLLFGVLSVAASAAHAGSLSSWTLPQSPQPVIDLNAIAPLEAQRRAHDEADLLLHRPGSPPQFPDAGILPSVTVGPFHASLGGAVGARARPGGYEAGPGTSSSSRAQHGDGASAGLNLDAEGIWGSHVNGSVTSRSARITFTLPMP